MDNRRLFLAVLLSLAVLLAWQYFFPAKPNVPAAVDPKAAPAGGPATAPATAFPGALPAEAPAPSTAPGAAEAVSPAPTPAGPPIVGTSEERPVLEIGRARAVFTNRGAQLVSFQLKGHKAGDGKILELVRARAGGPYPYGLVDAAGQPHPLDAVLFAVEAGPDEIAFRYRGPAGEAEKRFRFDTAGMLVATVVVPGRHDWRLLLGPGARDLTPAELESRYLHRNAIYATAGGEVKAVEPQKAEEPTVLTANTLRWVGLQDNYYLVAAIAGDGLAQAVLQPMLADPGDRGARFLPVPPKDRIGDREKSLKREYQLLLQPQADRLSVPTYWGDKEYARLASLPYGLVRAVDLGTFSFLAKPLLAGLHWIHDHIVANYGWAIILMTVLIKLVLLPLTHKSYVSMQKMQQLNPKMQSIRDKYKSKMKDKQGRPNMEAQKKMNEEIMGLYKAEGVNPAGGCLPMMLQLPILFAFFKLLTATVELRNAPWILWIHDLSEYDPHYVLPVIMAITQFLQTRMTPMAGDPMQRRMFQLMPLFMLFFFVWSPSGLVLYWLTNNILTIMQQAVYNHLKQRTEA